MPASLDERGSWENDPPPPKDRRAPAGHPPLGPRIGPLARWKAETVLAQLFIQMTSVAIGAFIAIDLTERQNRHTRQRTEAAALRLVQEELSASRSSFVKNSGRNRDLAERLGAIADHLKSFRKDILQDEPLTEAERRDLKERLDGEWGVDWHAFPHNAWNVAVSSGAFQDLDPRLLKELSEAYVIQRAFPKMDSVVPRISGLLGSIFILELDDLAVRQKRLELTQRAFKLKLYLQAILTLEDELIDAYDRALEAIETHLRTYGPA